MSASSVRKIQPLVKHAVDIVVPCYNPPEGWEVKFAQTMGELQGYLPHCQLHVIVVDDCSRRNFSGLQEAYLKKNLQSVSVIHNERNSGKGKSIRNGLIYSTSPYVIYTDADLPYDFESISRVVFELTEGADLVFGVRSHKYYEKLPLQRKIVSKLLQFFNRYVLRLEVTDTQCGLKGLNERGRTYLKNTKSNSYLFDLELMLAAKRDQTFNVKTALAETTPSFEITNLSLRILIRETVNLFKIIFKR